MSEIVKADGPYLDALAGEGPLPLEPSLADDATGLTGEQRRFWTGRGVHRKVVVDRVEHEAGDSHSAATGLCLRFLAARLLVDCLLHDK
jgi:hypothetical protein